MMVLHFCCDLTSPLIIHFYGHSVKFIAIENHVLYPSSIDYLLSHLVIKLFDFLLENLIVFFSFILAHDQTRFLDEKINCNLSVRIQNNSV